MIVSANERETLCIQFEEMLTDEQLMMFHKLFDLQSATSADEARIAYKAGFKDGARGVFEIMA